MARDWALQKEDSVSLTANTVVGFNLIDDYETIRGLALTDFTVVRWIIDLHLEVTASTLTNQFCRVGLVMVPRATAANLFEPETEYNSVDWMLNTTVHFNGSHYRANGADTTLGLGQGNFHWDIEASQKSRNGMQRPTLLLKAEQASLMIRIDARVLLLHP